MSRPELSAEPATVGLLKLGSDGSVMSNTSMGTPRNGFLTSPTVAASSDRVLMLWIWSSFGGTDDTGIEGATMTLDGTVERPCD